MIARTQTARTKLVSALRHSVVVMSAIFLVTAGGLGIEIVLKNRDAAALEHEASLVNQNILATKGELNRADRLAGTTVATDVSAVNDLHADLQDLAKANHCGLIEFQSSSEVAPFLTRFAKLGTSAGWSQVEVQASLSGKAKDVEAALAGLIDRSVPFEFDSIEISRDKVNEIGDATVIGHVSLRVLMRTAKGAA